MADHMYYFTKNEHLINELANSSLYFSSPVSFNDPLDCDFRVLHDHLASLSTDSIKNLKLDCGKNLREHLYFKNENKYWNFKSEHKKYTKSWQGHIDPNPGLPPYNESPLISLLDVVETEEDDVFLKKLHEWTKALINNIGVKCFTKTWSNFLLWSHYANNHRGVCVGVVNPHELFLRWSRNVGYFAIHYTDIKTLGEDATSLRKTIQSFLTTKFSEWEYEQESRVISFRGYGFIRIKCPAIQEVTFGDRWFFTSQSEESDKTAKSRQAVIKAIIDFRKKQHKSKMKLYVAESRPSHSNLLRHEIHSNEIPLLLNAAARFSSNEDALSYIFRKRH